MATAIRGGAGADVDRVELYCRPLGPAGFGAELFAGSGGGGGGTPYDLSCPAGLVLTGVFGDHGPILGFPLTDVIATIGVECKAPNALTGPPGYTSGTFGTPTGTSYSLSCPSGQAIKGISGAGGTLIDRLAIRCQ